MKKILMLIGVSLLLVSDVYSQAPPYPTAPTAAGNIVKAEYFFDFDPGYGNGTDIPLTPATDMNNLAVTLTLNGSALTTGFHKMYIRVQDVNGNWSHTENAFFSNYSVPVYPSPSSSTPNITAAEYFIDSDPGLGMGTPITVPTANDISSFNVLIDISSLTKGTHIVYIRTRDASGNWSHTNYALFTNTGLTPYPTAPAPAPNLSDVEYFIDTDPGFGNGTPITIPATTDLTNFAISIPIASLSDGPHTIYIRSRQNPWSMSAYADFLKGSPLPVTWLYVKGEAYQSFSRLTWATSQEINTSHYDIEYSRDGSHYMKAGSVTAKGQSSETSTYTFDHETLSNGIYYYRIKQVDIDGKSTYSKIITLKKGDDQKETYIMPNPVENIMHIIEPEAVNVQQVDIYDMAGRKVLSEQFGKASQRVLSVSISRLLPGSYVVKVSYIHNQKTFTIIKK